MEAFALLDARNSQVKLYACGSCGITQSPSQFKGIKEETIPYEERLKRAKMEAEALLDDKDYGESYRSFFISVINDDELNQHTITDKFYSFGLEDTEYIPGYGYDINDMAQLAAIQRRFAELYKALPQASEVKG